MKHLTWKTVIAQIKAHGGICRGTVGGEHVVKIAGGTYYTSDPEDAIDTAKAMFLRAPFERPVTREKAVKILLRNLI
jgi:hypothetical protein